MAQMGIRIRCGSRVLPLIGRRVAITSRRQQIGCSTECSRVGRRTVRVAAEDVLHIYAPRWRAQIRGLPRMWHSQWYGCSCSSV